MSFNADQQSVFDECTNQTSNVFCTGQGGTGKSWLLSKLVETLRTDEAHKDKTVAVAASTGLAALNIGGTTLHKFAGVQIVENNPQEMIKRARRGGAYANWVDTDVLIIDEISMISATFFDNLSLVAQDIRESSAPFGGMRLIMFGDFLQLPPVSKFNRRTPMAFESTTWHQMSVRSFMLRTIVRQSDTAFKNVLSSLRLGTCDADTASYMNSLSRDLEYTDSVKPVTLFPLRASVDDYNAEKLGLIQARSYVFNAIDHGDPSVLKQCVAPKSITLKVGAQVMITRNLTPTVVNGSLGIVSRFEYNSNTMSFQPVVNIVTSDGSSTPITLMLCSWESVTPNGQKIIAKRVQIPVILAWATTIHKSQGQTIPRLVVDLQGVFECGQTYVALSRAVDSSNLQVKNFTRGRVKADMQSVEFYTKLEEGLENDDGCVITVKKPRAAKVLVGFAD